MYFWLWSSTAYKQTFKLNTVLNDVIAHARILIKEGKKINFDTEIHTISLFQDKKVLESANIINNALKYSGGNSVSYISAKQSNFETTIEVSDNEIGMSKKVQKNIFKRYFRAQNALFIQGSETGLNSV